MTVIERQENGVCPECGELLYVDEYVNADFRSYYYLEVPHDCLSERTALDACDFAEGMP